MDILIVIYDQFIVSFFVISMVTSWDVNVTGIQPARICFLGMQCLYNQCPWGWMGSVSGGDFNQESFGRFLKMDLGTMFNVE